MFPLLLRRAAPYLVAFLAGFICCLALRCNSSTQTPYHEVVRTTTDQKDSVLREERVDSSVERHSTARNIPVAPAELTDAKGIVEAPGACPVFSLPYVAIPDSAGGYYTLALIGIDPFQQIVRSIKISHSDVTAVDTTTTIIVNASTSTTKTTNTRIERDSTITRNPGWPLLSAFGEFPVYDSDGFALRPANLTLGVRGAWKFGGLTLYLAPCAEVLKPLKSFHAKVGASVSLLNP